MDLGYHPRVGVTGTPAAAALASTLASMLQEALPGPFGGDVEGPCRILGCRDAARLHKGTVALPGRGDRDRDRRLRRCVIVIVTGLCP
ncbi:MAG TPA: hypothetical protein VJN18_24530 [Polyangiaceae bacterium]|nr:hypothetical protein [Polyangiaceae bacterium]